LGANAPTPIKIQGVPTKKKTLRRIQAAAISNVELLTTSLPCGIPNRTYMHMQLAQPHTLANLGSGQSTQDSMYTLCPIPAVHFRELH
jgi:hypothetical protein